MGDWNACLSIQAQTRASDTKRAVPSVVWCGVWDVPTRRGGAHMQSLRKLTPDRLIHIMITDDHSDSIGDDFTKLYRNHSFVIFLSTP